MQESDISKLSASDQKILEGLREQHSTLPWLEYVLPIHIAAHFGNMDALRLLISLHCPINAPLEVNRGTALELALHAKQEEAAIMLLQNGGIASSLCSDTHYKARMIVVNAATDFKIHKHQQTACATNYPLLAQLLVSHHQNADMMNNIRGMIDNSQQVDGIVTAIPHAIKAHNTMYVPKIDVHRWRMWYFCTALGCYTPVLEALYECNKIGRSPTAPLVDGANLDAVFLKDKIWQHLFKEDARAYNVKN